jgi:hypothetical protein
MKFFDFALEIERHRKKLGIHGANPEKLEKQFLARIKKEKELAAKK